MIAAGVHRRPGSIQHVLVPCYERFTARNAMALVVATVASQNESGANMAPATTAWIETISTDTRGYARIEQARARTYYTGCGRMAGRWGLKGYF